MIELRIDGEAVELRSQDVKLPCYDIDKLHSVEAWRMGDDVDVEVLSTPQSDKLLCYAFDLNRGHDFNHELHTATITMDGVEVYKGIITLMSVHYDNHVRYYRLRLRTGGAEWADMAATTSLNDSNIEVDMRLLPSSIEASWYGDKGVRYLPLRRDSYPKPQLSNVWLSQHVLMPNDYHPFISVKHLLLSMAQASGYEIDSRWIESPVAEKLMISGAYRHVESAAAERDMGFKAYRTYDYSNTANEMGYVYATEPKISWSVGAIVDTVNPEAVGAAGEMFVDAYNRGALKFVNGQPVFTPTRDVNVAFEYEVRYITDYVIESSRYLRGFNRVRLGVGCELEIALENKFENMRSKLKPNMAYKLYIFNYDAECQYLLDGIGEVSGAVSDIVTPEGCATSTKLYVKYPNRNVYVTYVGDWALYSGHVEPTGRQEVRFTVRTPYHSMTASSAERFYDIAFYGANPGQELTLCSGCSLRPIFGGGVGYGDSISFSDIANHNISQQQLIEAIAHMFNLCIYSHEPSRRLIIEPYDDFFNGAVVDWRGRQVSDSWSMSEGAPTSFELTRIGYIPGDGVVVRDNVTSDSEFGVWSISRDGYGTKQGVDTRLNPLFRPTLSTSGFVREAPSAEVLTVGNRDLVDQNEYVEPRVVLYHGMTSLPAAERWSSMDNTDKYPFAAFHSDSSGYTLCFEDRDGCEGLHRYYDTELDECAERGELKCGVYMPVDEFVELFNPYSSSASIRSTFRLKVEGGESLFRLAGIDGYDYEQRVAICRFRRMLTDN